MTAAFRAYPQFALLRAVKPMPTLSAAKLDDLSDARLGLAKAY